jgi:hypothetical protein
MPDNDKLARGGKSATYDNGDIKVSQEKWDQMFASEAEASVALDGDTRRACNNPDCSNDWPCAVHPDKK